MKIILNAKEQIRITRKKLKLSTHRITKPQGGSEGDLANPLKLLFFTCSHTGLVQRNIDLTTILSYSVPAA